MLSFVACEAAKRPLMGLILFLSLSLALSPSLPHPTLSLSVLCACFLLLFLLVFSCFCAEPGGATLGRPLGQCDRAGSSGYPVSAGSPPSNFPLSRTPHDIWASAQSWMVTRRMALLAQRRPTEIKAGQHCRGFETPVRQETISSQSHLPVKTLLRRPYSALCVQSHASPSMCTFKKNLKHWQPQIDRSKDI